MEKRVLIAGGGIIGLTTAYYLNKAGHHVTIIDRHDFLTNCSTRNAGLIVPSHFVPLASPGIVWQGIKWIFNDKSPFSINIKADIDLAKWGFRFWNSSTRKNVRDASPVLFGLNSFSKELYKSLDQETGLSTDYNERGLLMLFRSAAKGEEEVKMAEEAHKLGILAQIMTPSEIRELEPETEFDVKGGIFYPGDASIMADRFMISLINYLKTREVSMLPENELIDISISGNRAVKAITNRGTIDFDELVISGGVQSQKLFNKLGANIQVQSGKGYSFSLKTGARLNTPLILTDARVSVTPYENFTRFAGAMEIGGVENSIKKRRILGMVESINRFIPGIKMELPAANRVWSGLRPCSVDGLPYIGRLNKYSNIVIATGHSMMGVSLAPATGKLVEELISGKSPSVDLKPFRPER
ncbi:MAG: FAD-binding oxidoreductase [Bacteroidia bacterium]|nr:MAG: FAD-binding oxidoreductase [Bacteroidia bacterium]